MQVHVSGGSQGRMEPLDMFLRGFKSTRQSVWTDCTADTDTERATASRDDCAHVNTLDSPMLMTYGAEKQCSTKANVLQSIDRVHLWSSYSTNPNPALMPVALSFLILT